MFDEEKLSKIARYLVISIWIVSLAIIITGTLIFLRSDEIANDISKNGNSGQGLNDGIPQNTNPLVANPVQNNGNTIQGSSSSGGSGGSGGGASQQTTSPTCSPTAEICDNLDNDCDGLIDENILCSGEIYFTNGQTSITLYNVDGNIYLTQIENQNGVIDLASSDQTPLYGITITDLNQQDTLIQPKEFQDFSYFVDEENEKLFLSWGSQTVISEDISVNVEIALGDQLQNDEGVGFSISVDNKAQQHALFSVSFPNIMVKSIGDPSKNVLFFPTQTGKIRRPYIDQPTTSISPHPTAETAMQFYSFYNYEDNKQLYLQTIDSEGYSKDIVTQTLQEETLFSVTHYPEDNIIPNNDYTQSWGFEISIIPGASWYDASKRYRTWALQQPWMSRGKIESSSDFSSVLKKVRLFTLQSPSIADENHFNFMKEEGLRLKNFFNLGPKENILLWYNWHTNKFDHDLPTELPPINGAILSLTKAQAEGIIVIPYFLAHIWTVGTDRYISNNIQDLIPHNRYGEPIYSEPVTLPIQKHAELDPTIQNSRMLTSNLILQIVDLGFNEGFYWDVWSGFLAERDYSQNRDHVIGGGNYWAKGKIQSSEEVKSATKQLNPDFLLSSEHFQEFLIPNFEMFYLQTSPILIVEKTIYLPAWESVYQDYIMATDLSIVEPPIPNTEWKTLVKDIQAYLFHMGNMVAMNNWDVGNRFLIGTSTDSSITQEQSDVLNFIKSLVESFDQTKKYQRFGERLRPLPQSAEYMLEHNTLSLQDIPVTNLPTIQASVWKASDGDIGIIVTNTDDFQQSTDIQINYQDYDLSGEYELYELVDGVRTIVNPSISSDFTITATINPDSLNLYELVSLNPISLSPETENNSIVLLLTFFLLNMLLITALILLNKIKIIYGM